jgi:branched-chain amino acid transport system substrate-binding protein
MQSWYWDLNDRTREFAKRFFARRQRMPNDNQVAIYSSVRHYLEAVARVGTDDALTVAEAMREAPIHDIFTENGTIRADGRVLYDRYLMRVKSPAQSKYPWDYLEVVAKIPAAEAFRRHCHGRFHDLHPRDSIAGCWSAFRPSTCQTSI